MARARSFALAVGIVLALGVAAAACGDGASQAAAGSSARVVRVIDGDTLVVHVDGRDEHVRLIGIDTPETKKPGTPVECFGPQAAAELASLLPPGTAVRLERDQEARDRYDRLLAYVYRDSDGLFVERAMLDGGYAGPLVIAPNTAHRTELEASADAARAARRGLWGACGGFHVPGGG